MAKSTGTPPADQDDLNVFTSKLIGSMQQENANMKITREPKPVTLDGRRALSTYLSNDAPGGGQETDWLVTVLRPEGLVYFVFVAPEKDYDTFGGAFAKILDSIQFKR